ncbi:hypothetical protein [uncultured Aquimarina sp.]|uniref:hypothetical protein n=1 Tax=uncultured Aquimarina sp. TaxID=575652 RepID=UPI002622AE11|nr:hypothetical protein [uncultured Aquimarina sp.]
MSSNKSLLLIILVLFIYILTQRQCNIKEVDRLEKPQIIVVKDTIYQTKVDTFQVQTTKYKTVYVPKTTTESIPKVVISEKQRVSEKEKHLFEEAREYRDTLYNDDIEIYSYNLLKGKLLNSDLVYKLKVPREIKTTTTIEHPPIYRSGLYGFGEVGGNHEQFNNISLGLQYSRKRNWFLSYRLNFIELSSITHNVGVGIRIQ